VGNAEENAEGLKFGGGRLAGKVGARREGEFSCKRSGLGCSTIPSDALRRERSGRREATGVGCLLEAGRVGPSINPLPRTSDGKADASRPT
jgi:hypothetical protein